MFSRAALRHGWLLAMVLMVAACTDGAANAEAAIDGEPTSVLDVTARLDADNALRGEVIFSTDNEVPATVTVHRDDGAAMRIVAEEATLGEHVVPLIELRPDTEYLIDVEAGHASGSTILTTGSLPPDLPPLEVTSDPDRMTPGLTLFNAIPFTPGAEDQEASDNGYLLAVDAQGEVVWYYRQTHSIQDVQRTDDGHLVFIHHETGVRRIDPTAELVAEWSGTTGLEGAPTDGHGRRYAGGDAIAVDTDQMHHEVIELPNGNLMTLSRELRTIEGFPEPLCEDEDDFDGSYQVVTDTVVEFEPDDGRVVAEWSLLDMTDPLDDLERIRPSEFCSQYLAEVYPDLPARDWTHANAVILDEERNVVLVSVRHLDKLMAIRYSEDENGPAGELVWSLGEGGDFTLEEGEWFLHPHAPELLDDGSIMIYDNGNERPGTSLDDPDRLPYSRAVQYAIDTEAFTATQVWEHRADAPGEAVYAPFVGDADLVGEGASVLITHGGLTDPPAHSPNVEGTIVWGQIIETEYDTGEIVFDLRMKDPERETGWIIYRAERIDTLYPAGFTVEPVDDPVTVDE